MLETFEVTWKIYALLLPCVFFAGLVDAIAGGGGLLSIPGYLAAGVPTHLILGTNKLSASCGTIFSMVRFIKHRMIDLPFALKCGGVAMIGSFLGAKTALQVNPDFLRYVLILVVPVIVWITLRKPHIGRSNQAHEVHPWRRFMGALFVTLAIGFYDGFFGPGTGSFLMLFFAGFLRYDFSTANGNTKIVNFATNITALLTFIRGDAVLYTLGIPAAMANILGNVVGSRLVITRGRHIIRPFFLGTLALLFTKILYDLWQSRIAL